jgi:hypothetical protein
MWSVGFLRMNINWIEGEDNVVAEDQAEVVKGEFETKGPYSKADLRFGR